MPYSKSLYLPARPLHKALMEEIHFDHRRKSLKQRKKIIVPLVFRAQLKKYLC